MDAATGNAVRIEVRSDDIDTNGHVSGPTYLVYADHARWTLAAAAGASPHALTALRRGPVNLETTARFRSELRLGDEVSVETEFEYGPGATGRVRQRLVRTRDGTLAAEVSSVVGILDLDTRRLVRDPAAVWRQVATRPEVLGL